MKWSIVWMSCDAKTWRRPSIADSLRIMIGMTHQLKTIEERKTTRLSWMIELNQIGFLKANDAPT